MIKKSVLLAFVDGAIPMGNPSSPTPHTQKIPEPTTNPLKSTKAVEQPPKPVNPAEKIAKSEMQMSKVQKELAKNTANHPLPKNTVATPVKTTPGMKPQPTTITPPKPQTQPITNKIPQANKPPFTPKATPPKIPPMPKLPKTKPAYQTMAKVLDAFESTAYMGSIGDGEETIESPDDDDEDYTQNSLFQSPLILAAFEDTIGDSQLTIDEISDPLDKFDTESDTDRYGTREGSNYGEGNDMDDSLHDLAEDENLFGHLGYTNVANSKDVLTDYSELIISSKMKKLLANLSDTQHDVSDEPRAPDGKWTKGGAGLTTESPPKPRRKRTKKKLTHEQITRNEHTEMDPKSIRSRNYKRYSTHLLEKIAKTHSKMYRIKLNRLVGDGGVVEGLSDDKDGSAKSKRRTKGLDLNAYFKGKYPPILVTKQQGYYHVLNGRHRTTNFADKLTKHGIDLNSSRAVIRGRILNLDDPKIQKLIKRAQNKHNTELLSPGDKL